MKRHMLGATLIGLGVSGVAMSAAPAQSQPAADDGAIHLEEVLVTARRREESSQDIPISIQAASGEELEAMGVRRTTDLTNITSGFVFQTVGAQTSLAGLRGSGNRVGLPAVALFQDGVFLQSTQQGRGPIDVQRVELSKGPQNTLYGRSSIAGTLNYVTREATEAFEGHVQAGYGTSSSSDGEKIYNAEIVLSGPLTDTLRARLVLYKANRDGYLYSPSNGFRGGGYDRSFGRLKLTWQPNDLFDATLMHEYADDDARRAEVRKPGYYNFALNVTAPNTTFQNSIPVPGNLWETGLSVQPSQRVKDHSTTLTMNLETGIGTITSLSNYSRQRSTGFNDADFTTLDILTAKTNSFDHDFSEELRIAGGERLKYLLGGYYESRVSQVRGGGFSSIGTIAFPFGALGLSAVANYTENRDEFRATFGQLGFDITDKLTATAGLRWAKYEQTATNAGYNTVRATGVTAPSPTAFYTAANDHSANSGSFNLSYTWRPDLMTYISYARGDRPGNFNAPAVVVTPGTPPIVTVTPLPAYDPELANSYELGLKSTWLDQRLRFNATYFHVDNQGIFINKQEVTAAGIRGITVNGPDSTTDGLDLDLVYAINVNWRLAASATYQDSRLSNTPFLARNQFVPTVTGALAPAPGGNADFAASLNGLPAPRTPEFSGNITLSYERELGAGRFNGSVNVANKGSWLNEYTVQPTLQTRPGVGSLETSTVYIGYIDPLTAPGTTTINLSAGYKVNGWEFNAYLNNVTNEEQLGFCTQGTFWQAPLCAPNPPRSFEFTIRRNLGGSN